MNKRFHKRAIAAAAAVLTLTSAVNTANASQRNEITIESSASSVSNGDTFSITVGYEPDSTGASGFTVDLHYDTDAVNINIDASGEYAPSGGFAIVTNIREDDGIVRIVGANLNGSNVTDSTVLANLSFTVKDGYYGDIDFWTDVDTLVATDGEDFVNVDYRSYGPYDPFTVDGPAEVTAAPATATTPPTETMPPETEPTETETTTTEVTTEQSLPDEYIPELTEPETSAPEEAAPTYSEPDNSEQIPDVPDNGNSDNSDSLFVHKQGEADYNNEEALQYTFSPYDYISEADEPVDISVTVSSTGSAQGGIGMLTSDGWTIYGGEIGEESEQVWTANEVDLSDVSGDIAVQLYYLKNNSEFTIKSIDISPSDSSLPYDEPETDTTPEVTEPSVEEISQETVPPETSVPESEPVPTETVPEEETDVPTETEITKNSVPDGNDSSTGEVLNASASSDVSTEPQTTSVAQIESTVNNASVKADGNPDTGSGIGRYICYGITILCAGQIAYSIYALIRKNEE